MRPKTRIQNLMAQHFLLSTKARSLSIGTVLRMSDTKAEQTFAGIRWPATDGKAVCRRWCTRLV